MGIVIKKSGVTLPPKKEAPAVENQANALLAEIDALGEEQKAFEKRAKQIKDLQAQQKAFTDRLNAVRDTLQADLTEMDVSDDEEHTIVAQAYAVLLKKRGTSRTVINIDHVHALMGDETFYKVATVPLKAIDDYLTPEEKAGNEENPAVLEVSRTDRGITIQKKV